MGIGKTALRFLQDARAGGVSFERTLMLGRQNGFGAIPAEYTTADGYIEPLLTGLGAAHIDSLDNSAYEGANFVHDLNMPIPGMAKEKYTVVLDGGTLEHVFNFPQALKNAMEMVEVGGHYLGITPCNNWVNHGFYQFSPELYRRALSYENGFEVERMFTDKKWLEMFNPVLAFVQARRLRLADIFATAPRQAAMGRPSRQ